MDSDHELSFPDLASLDSQFQRWESETSQSYRNEDTIEERITTIRNAWSAPRSFLCISLDGKSSEGALLTAVFSSGAAPAVNIYAKRLDAVLWRIDELLRAAIDVPDDNGVFSALVRAIGRLTVLLIGSRKDNDPFARGVVREFCPDGEKKVRASELFLYAVSEGSNEAYWVDEVYKKSDGDEIDQKKFSEALWALGWEDFVESANIE